MTLPFSAVDRTDKVIIRPGNQVAPPDSVTTVRELVDAGIYGWRDMLTSINASKVTGASQPSWAQFHDGIYAYQFAAGAMNECWVSFHIDHDYAVGTDLYPHVHWSTTGTNTGNVRWGFEYTYAKGHQQAAFGDTTTVYVEQAATGTARTHMVGEVDDADVIPGEGIETDGLILMRVFRDGANEADTCTDAAFGFFVDIHYLASHYSTPQKRPGFF